MWLLLTLLLCHGVTLAFFCLDSLPLDDQAAGEALKLNIAGCQIADPLHFETHLIFVPGGSPRYGFFDSIGH